MNTMTHKKTGSRRHSAILLSFGIRFFLTAALTGDQILGGYAPFALGCVAAAGAGFSGVCALLGAVTGALFLMDFSQALPFLAACVLTLAAASAFRGSPQLSGPRAMSAVSAGLFLSVGLIYVLDSPSPFQALIPCAAAAGLTGASAWFFWPLLHPGEGRSPSEGVLFLSAALLLSMQEISLGGISLGRMLLCVLLAYTAFVYGQTAGTAAGLSLGLTADLCAGTPGGLVTAALGLGSLLCGRYHGGLRHRAALLFLGGVFAALTGTGDPLAQPLLMESGTGMLLFLLLPEKLFGNQRVLKQPAHEGVRRLREKLYRAAAVLRELYDNCGTDTGTVRENPAVIFDRAAERICRDCSQCEQCWKTDYTATFRALNDATPTLLDRGRAVAADFPSVFMERCVHLTDFLTAVNAEITAFLLRRRYRRQIEQARHSARGQYAQLSELLTAAASGLDAERVTIPDSTEDTDALPCRLGTATRPKHGETICGDTAVSFRTEEGVWCLLLADGMGSGEDARRESNLTCRLLREFLEAGIQPEAALQTLNSAMALRGEQTGSFTTMDLCTFDSRSGEAAFYKYGAAPSYLKKGGIVRRITGAGLPVGLRTGLSSPDVTRIRLDPDSFVVMISDGVADSGEDDWLQRLLSSWNGDEPQALAGAIMAESVRRQKSRDDCGIQILYRPAAAKLV